MFNIYQYERLEQDEDRRIRTSSHQPRKLAKYLSKYLVIWLNVLN